MVVSMSFMEHFIKFPELYLKSEEYEKYFKKGKEMNDQNINPETEKVIPEFLQRKDLVQTPEDKGEDAKEIGVTL